jgi:DNA polymerase epsilon subunit 3
MPNDVFAAMHDMEFPFMLPRLEAEVAKFTAIQADKRNTYRKKVREEKKAIKDPAMGDEGGVDVVAGAEEGDGDGERAVKRARMDGEAVSEEGDGDEEVDGDEAGDGEDEEVEDDEIEEEEDGAEGETLAEDALEEREDREEDDEMGDGDESD